MLKERDVDPIEVGELKHYYRYAAAAYGYWWYVLDRPVRNCCALWPRLSCCSSCCCLPWLQLPTGTIPTTVSAGPAGTQLLRPLAAAQLLQQLLLPTLGTAANRYRM